MAGGAECVHESEDLAGRGALIDGDEELGGRRCGFGAVNGVGDLVEGGGGFADGEGAVGADGDGNGGGVLDALAARDGGQADVGDLEADHQDEGENEECKQEEHDIEEGCQFQSRLGECAAGAAHGGATGYPVGGFREMEGGAIGEARRRAWAYTRLRHGCCPEPSGVHRDRAARARQ